MNRGVLSGLTPGVWQRYKPQLLCAGSGGETQPVLDDTGSTLYQTGQYLLRPTGSIVVEVQLQFIGTFSLGTGSAYVISLPVPARRITGPNTSCPIPIGTGMTYISFATSPTSVNVNCDVVPTLADPFASLSGDEDRYFQAYSPNIIDWGSSAIAGGTSSIAVTHKAGYAFNPEDIEITFTNSSANAWYPPYVSNITSTQFTVNSRSPNAASNAGFSYKIRGEPPSGSTGALMSPTVPWDWSRCTGLTPFGNFFFHLQYRPRR